MADYEWAHILHELRGAKIRAGALEPFGPHDVGAYGYIVK